jgi:hypothetical protein
MQPHRWIRITGAATLGVLVLANDTAPIAQGQGNAYGPPEVVPAVHHDRSRPLRDIPALPPGTTRDDFRVRQPEEPQQGGPDTALQSLAVAAMGATVQSGFDGVGEGAPFAFNVTSAPPDTVGEAGRTQYVQWVNTSFAVFDKATGAKLYGPAAGNTLWSGFDGDCATRNDGDPIVQYDQLADRWVLTQFSVRSGNYLQCVAVSQTEDATGEWYRYAFAYSQFPDYPKLAVWPDAYFITFNMFQNVFRGTRLCAYDRARMLQGLSATQQCFQIGNASLLPADLEGMTLPPPGSPAYFLNRASNSLNLWKFHVDFATPANTTLTGPTAIPVAAYSPACGGGTCIPQPGTSTQLDSLGDRLMYRLGYRNLGGGHEALVVNHSVAANGRAGIRWYEIDIQGGTPAVHQQSTYAPDDGLYRWMGSTAMDAAGNIAIGYSVSSSTTRPSIRFIGRDSTDVLNTMSTETEMRTGTGSQTGSLTRWGDYSTLSIDPVDDCTFWYTSEFLKTTGSFNWSTHIGAFRFASCGGTPPPPVADFALSATPSIRSITAGAQTTYSVSLSGTDAFTGTADLSVSGLPSGATGAFAPTSIGDGQSSTLTVTTSAGTPTGSHTLTITGTQGTLVRTTTVTLAVTAAETGDFTISASPGSRNIRAGASTSYNVGIARSGGFGDPVTLSVTTTIAGVTFTFSPNPAGGSSSTLNVATTAGATTGAHAVTISAAGGGVTRTTTVNLRIR